MTERGPEDGQEREPDRGQDPVDRHPPEEWRPGDAGDPMSGGAQPPGEPPHRFPHHDPPVDRHPPEEWRPGDTGDPMADGPQPPGEPQHKFPPAHHGASALGPESEHGRASDGRPQPTFAPPPGHSPEGPYKAQGDPYQDLSGGHGSGGYRPAGEPSEPQDRGSAKLQGDPHRGPDTPTPGGDRPGQHPTGAPPEPVNNTGELSEGPSGLDQSGFEHAGYAPGYGETDEPGAGAGSFPPVEPPPGDGTGPYGRPQGGNPPDPYPPGNYPPGTYAAGSQGHPPGGGYTQLPSAPTPWGKILGLGCGVALLLMLVAGGCMAAAMFTVSDNSSNAKEPTTEEPGSSEAPSLENTEVTADTTEFEPSPLYTGGEYTSVEVSVTNNSQEQIDVNPLYFTMIDQDGQNHSSRTGVGMDDNEIGAEKLSPGQATSGAVTVEGGDLTPGRLIFAPIGHEPMEVPID